MRAIVAAGAFDIDPFLLPAVDTRRATEVMMRTRNWTNRIF